MNHSQELASLKTFLKTKLHRANTIRSNNSMNSSRGFMRRTGLKNRPDENKNRISIHNSKSGV